MNVVFLNTEVVMKKLVLAITTLLIVTALSGCNGSSSEPLAVDNTTGSSPITRDVNALLDLSIDKIRVATANYELSLGRGSEVSSSATTTTDTRLIDSELVKAEILAEISTITKLIQASSEYVSDDSMLELTSVLIELTDAGVVSDEDALYSNLRSLALVGSYIRIREGDDDITGILENLDLISTDIRVVREMLLDEINSRLSSFSVIETENIEQQVEIDGLSSTVSYIVSELPTFLTSDDERLTRLIEGYINNLSLDSGSILGRITELESLANEARGVVLAGDTISSNFSERLDTSARGLIVAINSHPLALSPSQVDRIVQVVNDLRDLNFNSIVLTDITGIAAIAIYLRIDTLQSDLQASSASTNARLGDLFESVRDLSLHSSSTINALETSLTMLISDLIVRAGNLEVEDSRLEGVIDNLNNLVGINTAAIQAYSTSITHLILEIRNTSSNLNAQIESSISSLQETLIINYTDAIDTLAEQLRIEIERTSASASAELDLRITALLDTLNAQLSSATLRTGTTEDDVARLFIAVSALESDFNSTLSSTIEALRTTLTTDYVARISDTAAQLRIEIEQSSASATADRQARFNLLQNDIIILNLLASTQAIAIATNTVAISNLFADLSALEQELESTITSAIAALRESLTNDAGAIGAAITDLGNTLLLSEGSAQAAQSNRNALNNAVAALNGIITTHPLALTYAQTAEIAELLPRVRLVAHDSALVEMLAMNTGISTIELINGHVAVLTDLIEQSSATEAQERELQIVALRTELTSNLDGYFALLSIATTTIAIHESSITALFTRLHSLELDFNSSLTNSINSLRTEIQTDYLARLSALSSSLALTIETDSSQTALINDLQAQLVELQAIVTSLTALPEVPTGVAHNSCWLCGGWSHYRWLVEALRLTRIAHLILNLGEGRTDIEGNFSISLLNVVSQPILFKVSGGYYSEEVTNERVDLRFGQHLYGIDHVNVTTAGESISRTISGLSHVGYAYTCYRVQSGNRHLAGAITDAAGKLGVIAANIDVLNTRYKDVRLTRYSGDSYFSGGLQDDGFFMSFLMAGVSGYVSELVSAQARY